MTIRLTSKDDKLNASFTEMKKPIIALYFGDNSERNMNAFEFYLEQFESSFKPISLSEEAEKYLIKLYGTTSQLKSIVMELTEKACNVFKVKETTVFDDKMQQQYKWINVLHLKQTVTPEKPIEVNQDEIWGNVFAKIKQYGLNNEVLTELKSKYTITKNG